MATTLSKITKDPFTKDERREIDAEIRRARRNEKRWLVDAAFNNDLRRRVHARSETEKET